MPAPFTQQTTLEAQLGFAPPDPKRNFLTTGGRGGASPQQEAAILALTQRMASGVEGIQHAVQLQTVLANKEDKTVVVGFQREQELAKWLACGFGMFNPSLGDGVEGK